MAESNGIALINIVRNQAKLTYEITLNSFNFKSKRN